MIRQLVIENFRCLRAVTLRLEPLTVFVGANASGQSSVFAALRAQFTKDSLWARDPSLTAKVTARTTRGEFVRSFRAPATTTGTPEWPRCQLFQLDPDQLRLPNQLAEARELAGNGCGLANVFATLTRREQDAIAQQFCRLVPLFADVAPRPMAQGNHRIVFQDRWHPEVWYEPGQVSDGSMLVLAFLLLPHQSPPPDVIAIEEPERGLHPYLLDQLVRTLRRLAGGEIGPHPVQVLLSTHSAQLLECVAPAEVRFFRRAPANGETLVEQPPVDDPRWLQALRQYDAAVGDPWLAGGPAGSPAAGSAGG